MKNHLLFKVIAAILLAVLAGWLAGPDSSVFGITWVRIFDLIGKLFLNALTLVVIPLVVSSIITGTSRIGSEGAVGALGLRTFSYFLLTSLLAVLLGIGLSLWLQPGAGSQLTPQELSGSEALSQFATAAKGDAFDKVQQILYRMVPSNVFQSAAEGQILGLILFSVLFGIFSTKISPDASRTLRFFWEGVFQVMMGITHLVMRFMPLGVFGLVAKVAATTGFDAFLSVLYFFSVVLLGLGLHLFVTLPLLLWFIAKVNPIDHFRAMAPALVTAFSVSSSAASLPITLECAEERAKISNRVSSFTLPLGASINLQGTALYCTIAVLFIAQSYGMEPNLSTLMVVGIMGVLSAFGMVAGIPSASIVTIVIILQTLDLPPEGIVLILAVERILDMCRTVVSVYGNSCVARLVASNA